MAVRREQESLRELCARAYAAKQVAHSARLEARETLARCTEGRLARDGAHRGREERAGS